MERRLNRMKLTTPFIAATLTKQLRFSRPCIQGGLNATCLRRRSEWHTSRSWGKQQIQLCRLIIALSRFSPATISYLPRFFRFELGLCYRRLLYRPKMDLSQRDRYIGHLIFSMMYVKQRGRIPNYMELSFCFSISLKLTTRYSVRFCCRC